MRRTGQLLDKIVACDNLCLAYFRARRSKQDRAEVIAFGRNLKANLDRIGAQVCDETIPLGRSRQFVIHDPKQRVITAPCFEERVLHHAVMNVCEPVFERWLIDDTYACRVGRGRLKALARAQQFTRTNSWFLRCDIRQYFDSVPHNELLCRLERKFKDTALLGLFKRIVRSHRGTVGLGLPIGSLTSQHFANFYLGWLDRFVKEKLRVRGYVRYMDDFVIWGNSSNELTAIRHGIEKFVSHELGLCVKPTPYSNRSAHGFDFLGARIFPNRMVLNRRSRVRFQRQLLRIEQALEDKQIGELDAQRRLTSLVAVTDAGGLTSWCYRAKVLQKQSAVVKRLEPGQPGRKLEQLPQELPVGEPQQELAGQPEQQPGLPCRLELRQLDKVP